MLLYHMDDFTLVVIPALGSTSLQRNVGRRGILGTSETIWNTPWYLQSSTWYHVSDRNIGAGGWWRAEGKVTMSLGSSYLGDTNTDYVPTAVVLSGMLRAKFQ